ncbi:MAG: ABC transporter substrate-binding protein [Oceanospirillaceae bacterium]|nr:ABC transporter substrate-binding protein [Oceanospirillaceae bacterium]
MNKLNSWKNTLLMLGLSLACAATVQAAVESKDPIKLTLHDWTGQLISTQIMGEVLKKAGYNIQYVQADYIAQFAGLKTGDLHVAMEIWETTGREAMDEATATGKVENLGESGMLATEEWWYPDYMNDLCPGLPDWKALKNCAKQFSTPETAPMGRYLGAPVTWGGFDDERVEALDLPFEVVHAGTDAALFAELESAYQRKAPVLLWVYAPHWAPIKYKGEWVKFPDYNQECYSDPSWGLNPDMAYDCGKPTGPIWKVSWSGLKDKWPGAHKIIRAFKVDNAEMGAMISNVDLEGEKLEKIVSAWMNTNSARWQQWIK